MIHCRWDQLPTSWAPKLPVWGLGNAYTRPLGYIVIWVQVDGVWGYDEDQITLVIPDLSNFASRIQVILGTPTISQVINVMKQAEVYALATPWANCQGSTSPIGA